MTFTDSQYYNALEHSEVARSFAASLTTKRGKNDYLPFNFQADAAKWLVQPRDNGYGFKANPLCGIIGDEMGLGKTATALLALRPQVEAGRRFAFCVPGATVIQWQRNWDRWILDMEPDEFGSDGLFALRASGGPIPKGASCVFSHQLMAKHDFVKSLIEANFDGLIIDEGHKFGGRDTRRIKHLWALRNLSKSHLETARIVLTGTPVRNYADEIYNLLHFVAPDVASFRNFPDFARKYLSYDQKRLYNPRQFHDDIHPFYIRREVSEVQKDLPKARRTKVFTEITDKFIRSAYNKELDALDNFMQHGSKLSSGDDAGPKSLLGYLVKLRHITGIAKAKEPSIIEDMADYLLAASQRNEIETVRFQDGTSEITPKLGNKIAIGIIHRFVADRLELSLTKAVPGLKIFRVQGGSTASEKDLQVQAFVREAAPAVILMNMEAGGAGIDGLQHVCSKSYIFERMWNGADELQFEKRIHRTGQAFAVDNTYTIASGTIDEFFDELVEMKRNIAGQTSDENWETDGKFIATLAEKVVMNRLAA